MVADIERSQAVLTFIIEKLQRSLSRSLEVLWSLSIHQRCINFLLTEIYKYIHSLSPEIMNEVLSTRANIYNTRQFNVFETYIPTSNRYGLNSIPYKANQLWNLLPENLKSSPSLTLFKNEIKLWQCFNCPCNICKSYVPNLGYCVSRS